MWSIVLLSIELVKRIVNEYQPIVTWNTEFFVGNLVSWLFACTLQWAFLLSKKWALLKQTNLRRINALTNPSLHKSLSN